MISSSLLVYLTISVILNNETSYGYSLWGKKEKETSTEAPSKTEPTEPTELATTEKITQSTCEYDYTKVSCCKTIVWVQRELCIVLEPNWNTLAMTSTLLLDKKVIIKHDTGVGEYCYPKGWLNIASACLKIYWFEMHRQEKKYLVCFQAFVSRLIGVDFQCVQYENGKFSRNDSHQPPTWAFFNRKI